MAMFEGNAMVKSDQMLKGQCFATQFDKVVWEGRVDRLDSCPGQADTLHVSPQDFDAIEDIARMFPKAWGTGIMIDGEVVVRELRSKPALPTKPDMVPRALFDLFVAFNALLARWRKIR